MIKSAHLKNFQKHKDLEIKFTPGLNVIVGATDSGKSSVFRALKFCLWNEFKGVNIVRHGSKFSEVEVDIDDHVINRQKGKSKNTYSVDGLELKAFGAARPSEISDAVNLGGINIQSQHDSIFLLNESPGSVARYLNGLINIDIIDKTMSNLSSQQAATKSDIQINARQQEQLDEEIDDLKYIEKASRKFEKLQLKLKCSQDQYAEINYLEARLIELNVLKRSKEDLELDDIQSAFKGLMKRQTVYQHEQDKIEALQQLINQVPVMIDINFKKFNAIYKDWYENTQTANELRKIRALVEEYYELDGADIQDELEIQKAELKKICPTCPTCERKWK